MGGPDAKGRHGAGASYAEVVCGILRDLRESRAESSLVAMLLGTDVLRGMSAFLGISIDLKDFSEASGEWRVTSKRAFSLLVISLHLKHLYFLRFYLTREAPVW